MIEAADPHHPETVSFGAPSYMAWSPDGKYLLHHLVQDLDLVDTRNNFARASLNADSFSYRTPVLEPRQRPHRLRDRRPGRRQAGGCQTSRAHRGWR